MDTDLSMQMLTMNTLSTQNRVQIAVFKKSHEIQTDMLETLMASAKAAPPQGQGLKIDKSA